MYDLIVIGGGPSGLWLAREASSRGLKTVVLEEDPYIGLPVRCTGLLDPEVERMIGDVPGTLRRFRQMLVCRGGSCAELDVRAILVERSLFDMGLASMAAAEGAEIRLKTRAMGISGNVVKTNKGELRGNFVAIAEGAPANMARSLLGLEGKFVYGAEALRAETSEGEEIVVDVSDRRSLFRWRVPVGKIVKEGFVSTIKDSPGLIGELRGRRDVISIRSGLIPVGPPKGMPLQGGVAAVGDAAFTVKASSFGGILPGMEGSSCLASHLVGEGDFARCISSIYSRLAAIRLVFRAVHVLLDLGIWPRRLPREGIALERPLRTMISLAGRMPLLGPALAFLGLLLLPLSRW